jgi:glycosyltransferase involved in cell wall biosynthesis
MRIAFVTQPLDRVRPPVQNSLGIFVYEVARRLARQHEVIVYLYGGRWRFGSLHEDGIHYRYVPSAIDKPVTQWVERLMKSGDPRRPAFARAAAHGLYARYVADDLAQQKPDAVHVLNYTQFLPAIRRRNPQTKIVLHMECEWLSQLDTAWMSSRAAAADSIVGCSDFVAQEAARALPEFAARCTYIYNGVDDVAFSPAGPPRADVGNAPRLLFVARVSPEKGVHVLLDAFRRVRAKYPQAELDVVGGMAAAPREFIVDLSTDPRTRDLARCYAGDYVADLKASLTPEEAALVHFRGNLPYADLVALYRRADVFLFPSVWHEPFGMPNIEAMACGAPVVSTRGGGIPEVVLDGESGLLAERGDVGELAAAILRLLGDPELRRRLAAAGRARVEEFFTWDRIAADLAREYQRLQGVSRPTAPRPHIAAVAG